MPFYHSLGSIPAKRHIAFRDGAGNILHEHLMGNYGFSGPATLLYHIHPPTAVRDSKKLADIPYVADGDTGLRMRHFRTSGAPGGGSFTMDRTLLLFNNDVAIYHVAPDRQDEHHYRNGSADELIYISQGTGVLETQMGEIPFGEGDQLIIPRGILFRLRLGQGPHRMAVIESTGFLRTPRRYRNDFGQLKEGAPFSERDIRKPLVLNPRDEKGDFEIIVKHGRALHRQILGHHPLDVVGWDGYYFPWGFNVRDFEPIVGTVHLPPPIHQVLESDQFVYCNFCPRPYDFHPQAVPAPYNHTNAMSDEVLLYFSKEFMSRKGIEYGSVTLHPDGMPHGPHPGLYEGSIGKARTDEVALMVDTFRPLQVASTALPLEDGDYHRSWVER